jgi:hypothetical protein
MIDNYKLDHEEIKMLENAKVNKYDYIASNI